MYGPMTHERTITEAYNYLWRARTIRETRGSNTSSRRHAMVAGNLVKQALEYHRNIKALDAAIKG